MILTVMIGADSIGDASSSRLVIGLVILLALMGMAMLALAWWVARNTRHESEALGPLEMMGTRTWLESDPQTQRQLLASVRPATLGATSPAVDANRVGGERQKATGKTDDKNAAVLAFSDPSASTIKSTAKPKPASGAPQSQNGQSPRRQPQQANALAGAAGTAAGRSGPNPAKADAPESKTSGSSKVSTSPPVAGGDKQAAAGSTGSSNKTTSKSSDKTPSEVRPSSSKESLTGDSARPKPGVMASPAATAKPVSSVDPPVTVKPVTGEEPSLRAKVPPLDAPKKSEPSGTGGSGDASEAADPKPVIKKAPPGQLEPAVSENAGPNSKRAIPVQPSTRR